MLILIQKNIIDCMFIEIKKKIECLENMVCFDLEDLLFV